MKAFNLFSPDRKLQKILIETCFDIRIDYERFSFPYVSDKLSDEPFYRLFGSYMEAISGLDADNSGMFYNEDGLTIKSAGFTGRGYLYNFFYSTPGLPQIDMFCIEFYKDTNIVGKKYIGRIDFYSAFYYAKNILPKEFVKLYNDCKLLFEQKMINRTRIDIAFDFDTPLFDFLKYLNKSDNSKRDEKYWNRDPVTGWPNSVNYLPTDNKGYGVRYYNKKHQSEKKGKEWLYGNEDKENWCRVEYELYNPYSSVGDNELIQRIKSKIFNGITPKFKGLINYKPKAKYNSINSYNYFSKYSENHGVLPEHMMMDMMKEFLIDGNIDEERKKNFITLFSNFYNNLVIAFQGVINRENITFEDFMKEIDLIYPGMKNDENSKELFKSIFWNARKKID